jgi:putative ABC transport system permease protein
VHVFVRERRTAVSVLRCLGAHQRTVFAAYLLQAALLGFAGAAVGAAAGVLAQQGLPILLADAFTASPWLSGLERGPGFLRLTVTDLDAARRDILQVLTRSPVPLRRFEVEGASLEDVFVELLSPPAP